MCAINWRSNMLNEFQSQHEPLFKSEHALKLGQIHCMILVADNTYEKRAGLQKNKTNEEFDFSPIELTLFGKETAGNFIKWWVRRNITNLGQISKKIEEIMPYLDNLKRASLKMNQDSSVGKYKNLIDELRDFVEKHGDDIDALYDFVFWLNELGELSPCVLFTHPPWSTTQLSDRYLRIDKCNEPHVQKSTEIVFGLWSRDRPTLASIRSDMESEWAQSVDPEYAGECTITYETAFHRASRKILNEFALYFQKIRDSVELVQSEVLSFSKEDILKNEEFLKLFISKVLPKHRLECKFWDFKKTIPAWHNMKATELKSNFASDIASFANSKGGLLVIGINNDREIIGVDDSEKRIQDSRVIIEKYIGGRIGSIELSTLSLHDHHGKSVNCVIIIIPQTKEVMGVKETPTGRKYLFPLREGDRIVYREYSEIAKIKENINEDNFYFAKDIFSFVFYD